MGQWPPAEDAGHRAGQQEPEDDPSRALDFPFPSLTAKDSRLLQLGGRYWKGHEHPGMRSASNITNELHYWAGNP
jgi:hypothetical protein